MQCEVECLEIHLPSSLKYLSIFYHLSQLPLRCILRLLNYEKYSEIKITKYISLWGRTWLHGDKYNRNHIVQFVKLVADYPDEALVNIKLLFCTFLHNNSFLKNNKKVLFNLRGHLPSPNHLFDVFTEFIQLSCSCVYFESYYQPVNEK